MGFLELLKLRAGFHGQVVAAGYLCNAAEEQMPNGKTWLKMSRCWDSPDIRYDIEGKVERLVQKITEDKYDWVDRGKFYGPILREDELKKLKNFFSEQTQSYGYSR